MGLSNQINIVMGKSHKIEIISFIILYNNQLLNTLCNAGIMSEF